MWFREQSFSTESTISSSEQFTDKPASAVIVCALLRWIYAEHKGNNIPNLSRINALFLKVSFSENIIFHDFGMPAARRLEKPGQSALNRMCEKWLNDFAK